MALGFLPVSTEPPVATPEERKRPETKEAKQHKVAELTRGNVARSGEPQLSPEAVGDQRIKRRIGWFEGGLFNVGMIIGTGIFSNPALILRYSGSTGISLVLWVIGGLISYAGVLAFTELGTMLPRSGGEKEYLAYAFPKPRLLMSFLFAFNGIILVRGAGIANASLVFGNYINYAIYGPSYTNDYTARAFALAGLTSIVLINVFSVPVAIKLNSVVTSYKMLLVSVVIAVGVAALAGGFPYADVPGLKSNVNFDGTANDTGSYAAAIYYVMFAFSGWANINYVLDEMHNPVRDLPRAANFGIGTTTLLYFFANLAYFTVLTKSEILGSNLTVAGTFFTKVFPGVFGTNVLPGLVALSPFGVASSILYTGSRVILETAREGLLPFSEHLGFVHRHTNSPIFAVLLLYAFGVVLLFAPPPGQAFSFIVTMQSYTAWGFYFFAVVGLHLIRRREPHLERPIKAPLVATGFFALFALYQSIFSFVPPARVTTVYPYYLPYLVSVCILGASIGLWYIQVVVRKGQDTSYNARIMRSGEALDEAEVAKNLASSAA